MRALANGFLIVFALDAVLSVLDSVLLPGGAIRGVRQAVAAASLLWSIPVFFALAFVPALPKRVFLPLVLFGPFMMLAGMPLPLYVGLARLDVTLAFIQLALAAAAFWGVWSANRHRSALLLEEQLHRPRPSAGYTLRFALATVVLVPVLSVVYTVVCLELTLDKVTAGFIELRSDGLWAHEREYAMDDRTVRLVGMMHIGNESFYDEVFAAIPHEDAVVLAEGVTDEGALLESDLSYDGIAEALGLEAQQAARAPAHEIEIEHADVDMSAFSASTVEMLNLATATLGGDLSSEERMEAWREFTEKGSSPEVLRTAAYELLDMRNAHLLERFEAVLADYALVVIPWGAAHMPGIESALLSRGFEHTTTIHRRIVAF